MRSTVTCGDFVPSDGDSDMDVWLIHPAEPVPTDGDVRLFRYGALSQMLARSGHRAVQWASTFNHFTKTQRSRGPASVEVEPGYRVELLPGRSYRRHVGWQRVLSHRDVAARFAIRAGEIPAPDVIVVSLPTLELASAALEYAHGRGVPVIVDVRDLWPDVFLAPVPGFARPLFAPLISGARRKAASICRRATALTAVSNDYLEWGLRNAGRSREANDRVFYHAYRKPLIGDGQAAELSAKWDANGISDARMLRCCFFGTLGRSAGLSSLAACARYLNKSGHGDIEFVVAGRGPRERELARIEAECANVRSLGWLQSQDIAWIMTRCDVGLALYEANAFQSLPNKPIEYLAGSLPVLTTLEGNLAELLREYDCGCSFTPDDGRSMGDWLIRLKEDRAQRRRLSENAARLYQSHFDAARVYTDFISYLEESVQRGARRRAA